MRCCFGSGSFELLQPELQNTLFVDDHRHYYKNLQIALLFSRTNYTLDYYTDIHTFLYLYFGCDGFVKSEGGCVNNEF